MNASHWPIGSDIATISLTNAEAGERSLMNLRRLRRRILLGNARSLALGVSRMQSGHTRVGEIRMAESDRSWVAVASFGAGYEADIAIARLDAAGIRAVRRGNDLVGLFGPSFEGRSARGVDVLVRSDAVTVAREVLDSDAGTV